MPYTTYADLDNEIVDLLELVPEGKDADTYVAAKIAIAESEIDGRLGSLYAVPFDPVPSLIKVIALELTCYRILRPNHVKEDPAVSDWVDEYLKRADMLLTKLETGEVSISADTRIPISNTSHVAKDFPLTMRTDDGSELTRSPIEGL